MEGVLRGTLDWLTTNPWNAYFEQFYLSTNSKLPSLKHLAQIPLYASILTAQNAQQTQSPISSAQSCIKERSCPTLNPPSIDTCCLNHPSGHFLLTQFWDTAPSLGPEDAWTIHGLWPDLCSGGFKQFCDRTREYRNITAILESSASNPSPLIDFMETYWLGLNSDNEHLWEHEWNKHGTCISTIEPSCYDDEESSKFSDVVDYFVHATSLYRSLDTFAALEAAGITPSKSTKYSLVELENAIRAQHAGHPVTFRCNYRHELDEVWYHYYVNGPMRRAGELSKDLFIDATSIRSIFVPTSPDGPLSNCPKYGIKYLPKVN